MKYPWSSNKGGSSDSKGSNHSLTERSSSQRIDTGKGSNTSLGKHNQSSQVPGRFYQGPQSHKMPNRPSKSQEPEKEGPSIFDRWVDFRDKHLAGRIDSGFRKLGYIGKFVGRKVVNNQTANELKDKIIEEGTSFKNRLRDYANGKFSSGKEVAKDRLEITGQVLKGKLEQGKDVAKEKAYEKLSQGKDVAKEKLGQGGQILKEKLWQGTDVLKGVMKEQMQKGSGGLRDKYDQGGDVLKEKLSQGKDVLKEAVKDQMQKGSAVIKDKYAQGSSSVKEKITDASKNSYKNVTNAASNAYESISSAPQMVTQKVTRFSRRAGLYLFLGVTGVAFVVAIGNRLPQAYFDYQLKKQKLELEEQRLMNQGKEVNNTGN